MIDDTAEDSAVQDFLQILEEHRKNCEKQVCAHRARVSACCSG